MQYILTGFTHSVAFRVFEFDGISDDRVRTAYRVRADLALVRKHGIRIQELPLLCRGVLERRSVGDDRRAFTFAEDDMILHSIAASAEAEPRKKKPWRRPATAATSESISLPQPAIKLFG